MTITANAAIVEETGGPFVFATVELDDLRPNEILVRIAATGLCHTDLTVQDGHLPFPLPGILGHEGAGIVEKVGSSIAHINPGDHVALSFTSCGSCKNCRNGHPAYCANWLDYNILNHGRRQDGSPTATRSGENVGACFFGQSSFSTHAVVDYRSVVKIDENMPFEMAAALGCGIQTGAGTIFNVLTPPPGSALAVFGAGAVGMAAIMAANLLPLSQLIAVDRVASRLELARELGATHTIDTTYESVPEQLSALVPGGLDFAVDTTAHPDIMQQAISALGTLGTCALVGAAPSGTEIPLAASTFLTGKKIVGVTEGDSEPATIIELLATLHQRGRFPLEKIIHPYPFSKINEAAADARAGNVIKPVLIFE